MQCYEVNLNADGSFKVKEGLTWKRNGSNGSLSLDTPGGCFTIISLSGLPNLYIMGLQVFIAPLWGLNEAAPTWFAPVSGDDEHDGILVLIRSELQVTNWGAFIERSLTELADVVPQTTYGQVESDRFALVYFDFDMNATLKIGDKQFEFSVDEDGGLSINPDEEDEEED